MPIEFTMPDLSAAMTEGTIVKWRKKEGDKVKALDEVVDVETDKVTIPLETYYSGVIAHIAAKEGEKVKVGGLLAVIATAGENAEEIKKKYAAEAESHNA